MFFCDFEIYFLNEARCGVNTTAKFLQLLKRIILIAQNNGLIFIDPFANYRIHIANGDWGYLTQENIKRH